MEFVMTILEGAWRYVTTIRIADYLDIALMAYCCYLLLRLVRSTRAESLVKGIMVFLLALWISHVFKLNGIYFILNHMLDVGILALIVLFQPEIRRILEHRPVGVEQAEIVQPLRAHAAGLCHRKRHRADGARLHRDVQDPHGRADRL